MARGQCSLRRINYVSHLFVYKIVSYYISKEGQQKAQMPSHVLSDYKYLRGCFYGIQPEYCMETCEPCSYKYYGNMIPIHHFGDFYFPQFIKRS